jgi:hypothetical protein
MAHVGVVEAINRAWEVGEKGPRPHLGASQVGKPCDRALVYSFRHAVEKNTSGRMLRLFNRGHREEHSINAWLRMIGFEVREYAQRLTLHEHTGTYAAAEWPEDVDGKTPPDADTLSPGLIDVTGSRHHVECAEEAGIKLRQWAFADIGGHHAGSTDGKARIPLDVMGVFDGLEKGKWFGLEFKTYNTKSFGYLTDKDTVEAAKPEHYSQMQEYMHYMGLDRCLYIAVNKNDDDVYEEVVLYSERAAVAAIQRAGRSIAARQLPKRISNRSTEFICKFCDYKGPCHFAEPMKRGCRTCKDGVAVTEREGAIWHCARWGSDIPKEVVPNGCDNWSQMTD